jgi:hypothetical protein
MSKSACYECQFAGERCSSSILKGWIIRSTPGVSNLEATGFASIDIGGRDFSQ